MIEQTRIQTEQIGTRPLETGHMANTIHIGVDNFGVKYVGEEHANHLKRVLGKHYKLTCDWTGTQYIGITLDWNYTNRQVHLSMPNYVTKALKQFQHIAKKSQYAPYPCVPIQYSARKQYAMQELKAPLLNNKAK
jgi:hypothetical protein